MMFGTCVDRRHHATVHYSSGCPLQLFAERQNSGRTSPLLADSGLRRLRVASWGYCGNPHREAKCRVNRLSHGPYSVLRLVLLFPRYPWCDMWYDYLGRYSMHVFTSKRSQPPPADNFRSNVVLCTLYFVHMTIKSHMWDKGPSGPSGFTLQIQKLNSF